MSGFTLTRLIIGVALLLIAIIFFLVKIFFKNKAITAKFITRTGIFSAISIIIYIIPYLKFSVPFFPAFLELHFDEVPALIAGFAYGPLSAFFIILIKTIVKLPMSTSLCVGELADFLYSLVFVIPASLIYKKRRNIKFALLGLLVSSLIQIVVASIFTSFVILDFYIFMMGLSEESLIAMCQAVNPNVTSLGWTFCFYFGVPFNAFKDLLVVAITFILYKRMHNLIDKIKA